LPILLDYNTITFVRNAYLDLNYCRRTTYEENEVEEAEKVLGALRYATHFR